jgi:coenzyme PQQ precursor peptide PqqA
MARCVNGLAVMSSKDAQPVFEMNHPTTVRNLIMWTKPAYTDLRIGFEVTMYFANR